LCSAVWLLPPFFSSLPSWLAGWPSLLPQPSPTKFPAVPAKRWGNVGVSATVRDTRRPAVGRRWSPAKILKDPGQGGCGHGKRNGIHSVSWARPQAKRSKGKRRDGTLPVSGRPPRHATVLVHVPCAIPDCGLSWPDGGARTWSTGVWRSLFRGQRDVQVSGTNEQALDVVKAATNTE
jgi:hypothetical protein